MDFEAKQMTPESGVGGFLRRDVLLEQFVRNG
jgi:hypothetical protein